MDRRLLVLVAALLVAGCAAREAPSPTTLGPVLGEPRGELEPSPVPPNLAPPAAPPEGVVVHRSEARLADAVSYPGALPSFKTIPLGAEAWEPTLGVDPAGRVVFATIVNAVSEPIAPGVQPTLGTLTVPMVSTDGGRSWEARSPTTAQRHAHAYAADPFLHVDSATGRVYVSDLYAGCAWLSWSDDTGTSWRTNALGCGSVVNDHQSLFTGPPPAGLATDGYENVVYFCANNLANAITCARSLDGGETFEPARIVAAQPVEEGEPSAQSCARAVHAPEGGVYSPVPSGIGAVAPDGTVYLPWSYCGRFLLGVSQDAGETWENTEVARDLPIAFTHDPTVAVDDGGRVHALWIDADARVRLASSGDGGATWSARRDVSVPGLVAAAFPALTAGSGGRVAFAYYGTMQPRDADARWHAYVGMTLDALAEDPVFATGRATPEDDPIAVGPCEGRCPDDPGVGDFIGMAHDPRTGRVWVALADMCYDEQCPPVERPHGARATAGVQTGGTGLVALTSAAAGSPRS